MPEVCLPLPLATGLGRTVPLAQLALLSPKSTLRFPRSSAQPTDTSGALALPARTSMAAPLRLSVGFTAQNWRDAPLPSA